MRATTFLQIVPRFDRMGAVKGLRVERASTTHPREPRAGALVVRLDIDVPAEAFAAVVVGVNIPIERIGPVAVSATGAKKVPMPEPVK